MALDRAKDIAQAIVDFLPDQTYTGFYRVEADRIRRRWVDLADVSELELPLIACVPTSSENIPISRRAVQETHVISVICRLAVEHDEDPRLDDLRFLGMEIAEALEYQEQALGHWIGNTILPPVNAESLVERLVANTIVQATYRLTRLT